MLLTITFTFYFETKHALKTYFIQIETDFVCLFYMIQKIYSVTLPKELLYF